MSVFPAPRGEQGNAAFPFGCQKSGRKNLIDIVYFLSSRYRPGPPKSWEAPERSEGEGGGLSRMSKLAQKISCVMYFPESFVR